MNYVFVLACITFLAFFLVSLAMAACCILLKNKLICYGTGYKQLNELYVDVPFYSVAAEKNRQISRIKKNWKELQC